MTTPASHYREPTLRAPCSRCGADPGAAPLYAPDGRVVCARCASAFALAEAEARATDPRLVNDREARSVRRCAKCQQPAVRVVHVTFHYRNGIPTGRTYGHRCFACGAEFSNASDWRTALDVVLSVVLIALGVFALTERVWLLVLIGVVGVGILAARIRGIVASARNPIVRAERAV